MTEILLVIGGVAATAFAFLWATIHGAKKAREQANDRARIEDLEHADTIRKRNVDDRLREFDDAGFRD